MFYLQSSKIQFLKMVPWSRIYHKKNWIIFLAMSSILVPTGKNFYVSASMSMSIRLSQIVFVRLPWGALSRKYHGKTCTIDEVNKIKIIDLKQELKKRGISTTGLKEVLVTKLKDAIFKNVSWSRICHKKSWIPLMAMSSILVPTGKNFYVSVSMSIKLSQIVFVRLPSFLRRTLL